MFRVQIFFLVRWYLLELSFVEECWGEMSWRSMAVK
uniref:Uncharacterized protein n=1 Tax=Rhizophora mucronata TaxID=61149 RepID=A0A2P2QBZ2_RHIMU